MLEMELRIFLRLLYKYRVLIILTVTVFATLGYFISWRLPYTYRASMVVYVRRKVEPPSDEYFSFEGFYSQQAAREYTDTVVGFFSSIDLMKQALEAIDVSFDIEELKALSGAIRVKKLSPHLISVSIERSNADEVEKIITTLVESISDKIITLNKDGGDENLSLAAVDSNPLVEEIKPACVLNTVISALVGLLTIVVLLSLREYIKDPI